METKTVEHVEERTNQKLLLNVDIISDENHFYHCMMIMKFHTKNSK